MKRFFIVLMFAASPAYAADDPQQQASQAQQLQGQIQELYRERNDARAAADYWQSVATELRGELAQAQTQLSRLQPQSKPSQK